MEQVEERMRATFYLQRQDVNGMKGVMELAEDWPFLFHELGAGVHFQELTGEFDI